MKFGKIYTYENRKEALHLIGKKVARADSLCTIADNPQEGHISVLEEIREYSGSDYPFKCGSRWMFIREIIEDEEEHPKLEYMTNRQLAEWLSRGFGQWGIERNVGMGVDWFYTDITLSYSANNDKEEVSEHCMIRPWDSDEWIIPTVDIYERDCKGVK